LNQLSLIKINLHQIHTINKFQIENHHISHQTTSPANRNAISLREWLPTALYYLLAVCVLRGGGDLPWHDARRCDPQSSHSTTHPAVNLHQVCIPLGSKNQTHEGKSSSAGKHVNTSTQIHQAAAGPRRLSANGTGNSTNFMQTNPNTTLVPIDDVSIPDPAKLWNSAVYCSAVFLLFFLNFVISCGILHLADAAAAVDDLVEGEIDDVESKERSDPNSGKKCSGGKKCSNDKKKHPSLVRVVFSWVGKCIGVLLELLMAPLKIWSCLSAVIQVRRSLVMWWLLDELTLMVADKPIWELAWRTL
jgi:hypothetical protein